MAPWGKESQQLPSLGAQGHVGAIPKQHATAPVGQLVAKAILEGIIHPLGSPEDGPLLPRGFLCS